jgi:hypothetical protein
MEMVKLNSEVFLAVMMVFLRCIKRKIKRKCVGIIMLSYNSKFHTETTVIRYILRFNRPTSNDETLFNEKNAARCYNRRNS